jgi:hypothetical protein
MEKYYPPTPARLLAAGVDIIKFTKARDVPSLHLLEQDLGDASDMQMYESPNDRNPYVELLARATSSRQNIAGQIRREYSRQI